MGRPKNNKELIGVKLTVGLGAELAKLAQSIQLDRSTFIEKTMRAEIARLQGKRPHRQRLPAHEIDDG